MYKITIREILTLFLIIQGLAKDHEEEGLEDDTTEDIIDPWGVVNKPLRVINLRLSSFFLLSFQ